MIFVSGFLTVSFRGEALFYLFFFYFFLFVEGVLILEVMGTASR